MDSYETLDDWADRILPAALRRALRRCPCHLTGKEAWVLAIERTEAFWERYLLLLGRVYCQVEACRSQGRPPAGEAEKLRLPGAVRKLLAAYPELFTANMLDWLTVLTDDDSAAIARAHLCAGRFLRLEPGEAELDWARAAPPKMEWYQRSLAEAGARRAARGGRAQLEREAHGWPAPLRF